MPSGYWKDYMASSFASGSGTSSSPYIIKTAAQLARIINYPSTRYYYKIDSSVSEIDMSAHYWDGVYYTDSYAAQLDGNNKTITGLYCKHNTATTNTYHVGFINYTLNGAFQINNITFKNCAAEGYGSSYSVGIVVGYAAKGLNVSNVCIVNPRIIGTASSAGCLAGGAYFTASQKVQNIYVVNQSFTYTYNIGVAADNVGCLIGYAGIHSNSSGNNEHGVYNSSVSDIQIRGDLVSQCVGGVYGTAYGKTQANECSVKFDVIMTSSKSNYIGGIAGKSSYTHTQCTNYVDMSIYGVYSSSTMGVAVGSYTSTSNYTYTIPYYNTANLPSSCSTTGGTNGYNYNANYNTAAWGDVNGNPITYLWYVAYKMGTSYAIDDNGAIVYVFDLAKNYMTDYHPVLAASIYDMDLGSNPRDDILDGLQIRILKAETTYLGTWCILFRGGTFMIPYPVYPANVTSVTLEYAENSSLYNSGAYIYNISSDVIFYVISATLGSTWEFKNSSNNIVEAEAIYYMNASGNLVKSERTYYKQTSTTLI